MLVDSRCEIWTRDGFRESCIGALLHELSHPGLRDGDPASVRVPSGPRQNIVTPYRKVSSNNRPRWSNSRCSANIHEIGG
jgi:hypothetical protein